MEVIDLGLDPISLNIDDMNYNSSSSSSISFAPGIELLMNDKKKSSSNNVNIDLGELDALESELDSMSKNVNMSYKSQNDSSSSSSSSSSNGSKTLAGFASSFFGIETPQSNTSSGRGNDDDNTGSLLGQATKDSYSSGKTWDGFSKVNDIPSTTYNNMSDREKRRKKRLMLKKMEEWGAKGLYKGNTHFTMDSAYDEIEDEYEAAIEDKRKKDSVKLYGWWFMTFVNSVEYANAAFNPFDLNLDGWGEQVNEDIDSYDEIFSELHEKYKGGKLAPELSLLLRLGFSAAVVNFTNKALSSATPGFNDVIRQSPELMRMFTDATVNTMSQKSPGFAFASNMMNSPDNINTSFGPPPPPVETKNQPPTRRPPMNNMQFTDAPGNRQDINAARGQMFREQGVDMNTSYASANRSEQPIHTPSHQPSQRAEMRGPQTTDIDSILSGLKTRTVDIHPPMPPQQQQSMPPQMMSMNVEDDSMISISSLRDMQNTNMPKRSNRRRNRSDKNTISLDIASDL